MSCFNELNSFFSVPSKTKMEEQEGLEKGLTSSLSLPEERPYCSEDYLEQLPNSLHVILNIQAETVENKHLGIKLDFYAFFSFKTNFAVEDGMTL